jgi:hypothetical protein
VRRCTRCTARAMPAPGAADHQPRPSCDAPKCHLSFSVLPVPGVLSPGANWGAASPISGAVIGTLPVTGVRGAKEEVGVVSVWGGGLATGKLGRGFSAMGKSWTARNHASGGRLCVFREPGVARHHGAAGGAGIGAQMSPSPGSTQQRGPFSDIDPKRSRDPIKGFREPALAFIMRGEISPTYGSMVIGPGSLRTIGSALAA